MKVLLIEDNRLMAKSLLKGLKNRGYGVEYCITGTEGEEFFLQHSKSIDVVILDLMLPGKSGESICENVRAKGIDTPILMLTSKNSTESKVNGLEIGADDYLTKPFDLEELLARLSALTRRKPRIEHQTLQISPNVVLDVAKKIVYKNGLEASLSPKEYLLLELLAHNKGITMSRDEIFDHIGDFAADNWSNSVDVHIKNIRKKLFFDDHEDPIKTVRGIGYRLETMG